MSHTSPLRALRDAAGLTQVQVAGFLGRQQANVSQWEAGSSRTNQDTVAELARLYGVDTQTVQEAVDATVDAFVAGVDDRLAREIEATRDQLGLTKAALADAVRVTAGAVDFWEDGINRPSLEKLIAIAELTGRTAKRFLEDASYDDVEVSTYLDTGEPPNALAQLLRTGREAAGLTQTQVAHAIGSTQNAVSALETGVYLPKDDALAKMQRLYGLIDTQVAAARHAAEVRAGRIPTPTVPLPLQPANLTWQQYVREARAHHAMRRTDLAERLGMDVATVSELERDDRTTVPPAAATPEVLLVLASLGGAAATELAAAWSGVPGDLALRHGRDLVDGADALADLLTVLRFRGMTLEEIAAPCGATRQAASLWAKGSVPRESACAAMAALVEGATEEDLLALRHRTKHGRPEDVAVEPGTADAIFGQLGT